MRRVLVIAYYFPPLGMSGVQRTAGFVRHLPEHGWQPTVITPYTAGYFAYDESLLTPIKNLDIPIVRTRSLDPTRLFRSKTTVKLPPETKRKTLTSMSNWMFIPDNKIGWMPFALQAGLRLAQTQKFDAIFSTAPPYTGHLIARALSKRLLLPLITDFRDDWVDNPRHQYPTEFHRNRHLRLESKVLNQSSAIITINKPILDQLNQRHSDLSPFGTIIPHGHDNSESLDDAPHSNKDRLKLVYTGVFYDVQVPDYFLRGLADFLHDNPLLKTKISAIFAGLVPDGFHDLVEKLHLQDVVNYIGYKPHPEIIQLQREADILWMTIGHRYGDHGISTGKLFEYMGTQKPILGLVPPGTAQDTLRSYGATYLTEPTDIDGIKDALNQIKSDWLQQTFPKPDESFVSQFNRRTLTQSLAELMNSVSQT
ncbi:MAG: glycosyltransferase [Bacteroidetes bacterium]|nr:glycosyltransferase [Bacteroidota bacterium]